MKRINRVVLAGVVLAASSASAFGETTRVDVDFSETKLTCKDADLVLAVAPDGVFRLAGQVLVNHQITSRFEKERLKLKRPVIACISTTKVPSHRATELAALAKNLDDSVLFLEGESWTQVKLVMVAVTKD